LRGIEVIDLQEFLERESGKIRIDLVSPGWLIFSPGFRSSSFRKLVKRSSDLLIGVVSLLVSLPVMLLVAIAVKLDEGIRSPVLYRQKRVGLHGDTFELLKFRSMSEDAESNGEAVWAVENDDRVTRVGRVLRKYRLDELPQIINVLRGEMSIVGPRPERPEFVERLADSIPYYAERHTVKPGITGWAQLRYPYGASDNDAVEKLQYDLYYIKNQTLLLDIIVVLQTAEVMIWGKGAR
jgi:sugar transferase (PEP-CTERM system associated)